MAGEASIHVRDLKKVYRVARRGGGLMAMAKSLFVRKYEEAKAVDGITFDIQPGESVGFLGPNRAGKTTTLKMLAGLLYPTAGEVDVAGYTPFRRQVPFLQRVTLVMGQ